jgi:hypothetical protein
MLVTMTKELNASLCAFCDGKELAILTATAASFPMGEKCYDKSLKRNVEWNDDTGLTELKRRIRKRA